MGRREIDVLLTSAPTVLPSLMQPPSSSTAAVPKTPTSLYEASFPVVSPSDNQPVQQFSPIPPNLPSEWASQDFPWSRDVKKAMRQ